MFSPEIDGRRIGEARPEWEIFTELAKRVRPDRAEAVNFAGTQAIREEIARVVPAYDGIQTLRKTGDQVQYGGRHLAAGWSFPTPDGRARFSAVELPHVEIPEGQFALATRRGKQFNTMVHETSDAMTGARARDAVFMHAGDARALGLAEGDEVVLRNEFGELRGRVLLARIQPRNVQVYWPEGNVLIDRTRRSPLSNVPDYNAFVSIEPATAAATDRAAD
jgi:anaerobic selenocysteine-containing dehydrogenase